MEAATGCVFTLVWHLVADSIVVVQFLTLGTSLAVCCHIKQAPFSIVIPLRLRPPLKSHCSYNVGSIINRIEQ